MPKQKSRSAGVVVGSAVTAVVAAPIVVTAAACKALMKPSVRHGAATVAKGSGQLAYHTGKATVAAGSRAVSFSRRHRLASRTVSSGVAFTSGAVKGSANVVGAGMRALNSVSVHQVNKPQQAAPQRASVNVENVGAVYYSTHPSPKKAPSKKSSGAAISFHSIEPTNASNPFLAPEATSNPFF